MTKTNDRFQKVYSQGNTEGTEIWVDRLTGVNYLFHYRGLVEGFTPLLDEEGKPVITPCEKEYDHYGNIKVG